MLGWIEDDADGRSFLMRSSTGRVSALLPVGLGDEHGDLPFHTVVIEVDPIAGRPRSVRLSIRARVRASDPLHREAQAGLADEHRRAWLIAWHRHSWVPDEVQITSLDLQSDTQAWLVSLELVSSNAGESAQIRATGGVEHE
ncbi:MAG TPA: hypothetical protein DDY88_03165 [Actinobacteria bacterium]|nr:hypothetical protein [Actinomycetota bacterium]